MRWRAAVTVAALAAGLLGPVAASTTAGAATFPPEPTSMAQGNGFSLNHSDFENAADLGVVAVSNATVSQGTGTTMLHNDALKIVTTAAGNTVWKQADSHAIAVTPGAVYRIGEYFHSPAVAGDTVTYAVGGYSSAGVWQGWTSAAPETLANTTAWQWETGKVTIPASVTQVVGVRVTMTGTAAGDITRVDEATFASDRAGVAIGSEGDHCGDGTCGSYSATDWLDANATAPPGIGPLQVNKEFFGVGAGLTWSQTKCATIENSLPQAQWPVCIVAYKDQVSQAVMTAFMNAVPAGQQVVLVYHQEPEGDFSSGSVFVSEFEAQYAEYKAAGNFPNITMMMDSASFPYKSGSIGCMYIVPGSQTDGYLADWYEATVDGQNMSLNVDRGAAWLRWTGCVKGQGKPVGVAEEGYDQGTTSNVNNTVAAINADSSYLSGLPDSLGAPVLFRTYWDTNVGGTSGNWMMSTPAEVSAWQADLALNGGY